MQVSKKHFPVVGLLGLVVIAAGAGSIAYYQYVVPPQTKCGVAPVHRIIFMTAIIHERGGFNIFNAAILNQPSLPSFSNMTGADLTGVNYSNYKTSDNSTLLGSERDTITLYIKSISTNDTGPPPKQDPGATGHGFTLDTQADITSGNLPNNNLAWGSWYTVTFQVPAKLVSSTYHCTQFCSTEHPKMNGGFVVDCGA